MLPNTLSIVKENILDKKLDNKKSDRFIKLLSIYDGKRYKYLYPGTIVSKVGISMKDCYLILEEIEKLNIIEKAFEVYCPRCKHSTNLFSSSIKELPYEMICDNCFHEFDTLDGAIVLYKVIAL